MASSRQPPNESPVFFLDRGLGRHHVAEVLINAGFEVHLMLEVYPDGSDQSVGDDEWIGDVSGRGWVALTKDSNLIRSHRRALERSTLRVFALDSGQLTGPIMAERVRIHLGRILRRSRKPGPYFYVIHKDSLELRWHP